MVGVGTNEGNLVSLAYPCFDESGGQAVYPVRKLPICVASVAIDHRNLVRIYLDAATQEFYGAKDVIIYTIITHTAFSF
jgi:hypothetical protein